uniref:Solute carrier family 39 member 1 n=1 Tax=Periophthalmus magnuspinnatus TaxID=409849 RepID=A0A3B3ZU47_9GOBI
VPEVLKLRDGSYGTNMSEIYFGPRPWRDLYTSRDALKSELSPDILPALCLVQVLEICIAILVHKSIIVFSLSVKLVQSGLRAGWVAAYLGVFALMSPLGIAMGIGVMEARVGSGALVQAVLEGLAAGTFVYITFLEILPHELNSPGRQLLKVLFLLLGFCVMAGLTFVS